MPSPLTDPVVPLSADEAQKFMTLPQRSHFWSPNVPLFGRLRIVNDLSGIAQASVVVLYWLIGNLSTWSAVLLPYYADGVLPVSLLLGKKVFCCYCVVFNTYGRIWQFRETVDMIISLYVMLIISLVLSIHHSWCALHWSCIALCPAEHAINMTDVSLLRLQAWSLPLVAEWAKPLAAVHAGQGSLLIQVEA